MRESLQKSLDRYKLDRSIAIEIEYNDHPDPHQTLGYQLDTYRDDLERHKRMLLENEYPDEIIAEAKPFFRNLGEVEDNEKEEVYRAIIQIHIDRLNYIIDRNAGKDIPSFIPVPEPATFTAEYMTPEEFEAVYKVSKRVQGDLRNRQRDPLPYIDVGGTGKNYRYETKIVQEWMKQYHRNRSR